MDHRAGHAAPSPDPKKENLARGCAEQDQASVLEERRAWPDAIAGIAVDRFVFIDESAALTNLVRLYGWSARGERAPGRAPCGSWDRVTILGALGPEGLVAAMSIPASTDGAVFLACLEQVLFPGLRRSKPDAVLVMDNLAAHKATVVRALLDRSGFTYLYLPRHSPDLNPSGARHLIRSHRDRRLQAAEASLPGPRQRASCARPKRARWMPFMSLSAQHLPPSARMMPEVSFATQAMPVPTDPRRALVLGQDCGRVASSLGGDGSAAAGAVHVEAGRAAAGTALPVSALPRPPPPLPLPLVPLKKMPEVWSAVTTIEPAPLTVMMPAAPTASPLPPEQQAQEPPPP